MSDILIKNMELPKGNDIFNFSIDKDGFIVKHDRLGYHAYQAVAIPSHGRIVDISKVEDFLTKWENGELNYEPPLDEVLSMIRYSTKTIVEAST